MTLTSLAGTPGEARSFACLNPVIFMSLMSEKSYLVINVGLRSIAELAAQMPGVSMFVIVFY